jgi:opacity protein-like surface antigen
MKFRIHTLFFASIFFLTSTSASSELKGFYAIASAGSSLSKTKSAPDFKTSPFGSLGVGYHFNDMLRSDISLQHRKILSKPTLSLSFKDAHNTSLMWNMYLNLTDSQDQFRPYLTAGVGYGRNQMKKFTVTRNSIQVVHHGGTNDVFVWNAGVGSIMQFSKNLGVDFGYRYVNLGDIKGKLTVGGGTASVHIKDVRAHEFTVGLIVKL